MKQLWSDLTLYRFVRFFLFYLPTEFSHNLALKGLGFLHSLGLITLFARKRENQPVCAFGLDFSNPLGLAAGLDKNGDYIDVLGALGFGFVEIGTITPLAQLGNPRPRLFRLVPEQAIINRMGFNNKGVDHLVEKIKVRQYRGVLGVNIGKNFSTPVENALEDYLICLRKVYEYADYIVVNLSSPNTPGLRSLQFGQPLDDLLVGLKTEQEILTGQYKKSVPLLVKIAPDLSASEVTQLADSFLRHKVEGIIATNTTISRESVVNSKYADEAGGLSGAVLTPMSNRVTAQLCQALNGKIPVIGVGGIVDEASAIERLSSGAVLLQVYSGFIFQGPALIERILSAIKDQSE